jgi:hypothetical protein
MPKLRYLLLVPLFAACAALGYGCFVPRVSVERLERDLEPLLRLHTPRAQVEEWFRARGIPFNNIIAIEDKKIIGLGTTIPNTGPALGSYAEIRLAFYFDHQNNLQDWEVYEFVPSL